MDDNAVMVWRFHNAPAELKKLSRHGGDEDWLAVVPKSLLSELWIEEAFTIGTCGNNFGCCDVSIHTQPDGSLVYIGAHA